MERATRIPRDRGDLPDLSDADIDSLEAANGLRQFDRMDELIDQAVSRPPFVLTQGLICEFQKIAVEGLEESAGQLRTESITISGSVHVPPIWQDVERYLARMCEYVNDHWDGESAERLSAYVMWRINWIHPFINGNGRTSRAISYLVFCAKLGLNIPGDRTIPEIIDRDKNAYYRALEAADEFWKTSPSSWPIEQQIDVSAMERVILDALDAQLTEAEASADGDLSAPLG